MVVFDELHKHGRWKTFLKGFFDGFGDRTRIAVTGSAHLDVYRRGGDSLMGRYFLSDEPRSRWVSYCGRMCPRNCWQVRSSYRPSDSSNFGNAVASGAVPSRRAFWQSLARVASPAACS